MTPKQIDRLAKIVWHYLKLDHKLQPADAIIVLGSQDVRTAQWGANLFKQGYAPVLVMSGRHGNYTRDWPKTEAKTFAEAAYSLGVPKEAVLLEEQATNTGENIINSLRLLQQRGIPTNRLILVQKPSMERRTYATAIKLAPDKVFLISSQPIDYEDYPNEVIGKEQLINMMVGDLQRIIKYPQLGFQAYQEVPSKVLEAYRQLVEAGFNKKLIKEIPE